MFQKNQEIKVEITASSSDGNGIGHIDNMVVFVVGAVEDDIVLAHIIKVCKKYLVAKIKDFIKKSDIRIKSDCLVSTSCGGCVYREINYDKELEIKENNLYENIKRIGDIDLKPQKIVKGNRCGYRNKAAYPVDMNFNFGFYANKTHRIVPNTDCPAAHPIFEKILLEIKNWGLKYNIEPYNENNHSGVLRHAVLRIGEATNEVMLTLVINSKKLPFKEKLIELLSNNFFDELKSIYININQNKTNVIFGKETVKIYGNDTIQDIMLGVKYNISPLSFYQVNHKMTEKLYSKVSEYVEPKDKIILDLYCGAGTIGLSLAKFAKKIIGIEVVKSAIKDAKINARINNISNAEFICGDAYTASLKIDEKPDVVIIDPPRKGVDSKLLERISSFYSPQKIVYVSCEPSTLARDLKILKEFKYDLIEYTPFDMFPATKHVETVCLLSKSKSC